MPSQECQCSRPQMGLCVQPQRKWSPGGKLGLKRFPAVVGKKLEGVGTSECLASSSSPFLGEEWDNWELLEMNEQRSDFLECKGDWGFVEWPEAFPWLL